MKKINKLYNYLRLNNLKKEANFLVKISIDRNINMDMPRQKIGNDCCYKPDENCLDELVIYELTDKNIYRTNFILYHKNKMKDDTFFIFDHPIDTIDEANEIINSNIDSIKKNKLRKYNQECIDRLNPTVKFSDELQSEYYFDKSSFSIKKKEKE